MIHAEGVDFARPFASILMLSSAVILVATGGAGAGALLAAVGCTLMMGGMGHGNGDDHR